MHFNAMEIGNTFSEIVVFYCKRYAKSYGNETNKEQWAVGIPRIVRASRGKELNRKSHILENSFSAKVRQQKQTTEIRTCFSWRFNTSRNHTLKWEGK